MKIQILRTMRVIMRNWTKMENQSSPKPKGRNWIQLKWFYVVERSAYGTRNEKKFCWTICNSHTTLPRYHIVNFVYKPSTSIFSQQTALMMFELAWKLSRDSNDLLWYGFQSDFSVFWNPTKNDWLSVFNRWAIVGVAEQKFLGKVESKTTVMDSGKLQSHMIRLAHLSQQGDSTATKDALYIAHEQE